MRKTSDLIIKVLSLGVGMAVAMVLIAKVCFELSYDSFYADAGRFTRFVRAISSKAKARISVRSAVLSLLASGMRSQEWRTRRDLRPYSQVRILS